MTIQLNGTPTPLSQEITHLSHLLTHLGFAERPVVVEHNGNALLPKEYPTTPLTENDTIELVQVVAGG